MTTSAAGGGAGLEAALKLGSVGTIDELDASGLRGRGGAGFPTGAKWRTVADLAATVIVNGAEGEPGSFKDRTLLVRNPYRVLEGALIAARTVGADRVVVAVKRSFAEQIARLRPAIDDASRASAGRTASSSRSSLARASTSSARRRRSSRSRRGVRRFHASHRPMSAASTMTPSTRPRLRRRWPTTSRRWPTSP